MRCRRCGRPFEGLGDARPDGLDDARVVAADYGAGLLDYVVDVFPVCGVEANRRRLDQDEAIAKLGDGSVSHDFGHPWALDDDCFLGSG